MKAITAEALGNARYKRDYRLKYAYVAGAMYKGIASKELVTAMGKAGLIAYLGAGGMETAALEAALMHIKSALSDHQPYGVNLLCKADQPELEEHCVDLYLRHGVRHVEAAGFTRVTPSVVRYRLAGLGRNAHGVLEAKHRVMAKVSRPEVAASFMQTAPETMVRELLLAKRISAEQAELSRLVPVAGEVCVEADSGGHTDRGIAYTLMPAMFALRDRAQAGHCYQAPIHIGAAGGIGTPHAAAAAFIMGADFIATGSINQCTVEAGTSESAKDLLQGLDAQDMTYAPAGDMFELGAKVQVAKRGLCFPSRANELYELYQRHDALEEIDAKTRARLETEYFRRSIEEIWQETYAYYQRVRPAKLAEIERNPKKKMALVFKWYLVNSARLAMAGVEDQQADYQIHCGPALGAFNQWVKGTQLEDWRSRHVADLAERLMSGAAALINERCAAMAA